MATQNINGSEDPFYRYKMPRLLAKVEGNGNGIKTVVPNLTDIAKALGRHPNLPNKYFGFELGAQTSEKNEKYIVNGEHTAGRLNELLMKFIKDFVLCGKCKNPETELVILKDQTVVRNCKACGATTSVNQNHKLVNHILKTPGAAGKEKKEKGDKDKDAKKDGKKKGKEESKSKSKDGKSKKSKSKDGDESEDSNPEITKMIEAEAGPLSRSSSKVNENDEEDDDEQWTVDTTEHAVAERRRELAELEQKLQQKMSMAEDSGAKGNESDEDNSLDELIKFITGVASGTAPIEHNAVLAHAGSLRKDKIALAIIDHAIDENYPKQLSRWHRTFAVLVKQGKGKTQRAILGGIERLVGVRKPALLAKVSNILKAFYDLDLFDDEAVLAWAERASKKYVPKETSAEVKKKAEPFVTWIKTAEEESDEEEEDEDEEDGNDDADDDDDDDEVTPATSNGKSTPASKPTDEDFDIDAI